MLCPVCKDQAQTLGHVLNCCPVMLEQQRYTWRHDLVLDVILEGLHTNNPQATIWGDRPQYPQSKCPSYAADNKQYRPDIVVEIKNEIWVIELTVSFEANGGLEKAHTRKTEKYKLIPHTLYR